MVKCPNVGYVKIMKDHIYIYIFFFNPFKDPWPLTIAPPTQLRTLRTWKGKLQPREACRSSSRSTVETVAGFAVRRWDQKSMAPPRRWRCQGGLGGGHIDIYLS